MKAMIAALTEMRRLGQGSPIAEMFRVNAVICIKSMIQELPQSWAADFEFRVGATMTEIPQPKRERMAEPEIHRNGYAAVKCFSISPTGCLSDPC
jgi:hypothetical protein